MVVMDQDSLDDEEDEDEEETEETEETEEDEDWNVVGAARDCLLGSKEDKRALVDIITRFRRDDLASSDDLVVAAIRMQVHRWSKFQHTAATFLTCTLWQFLEPKEDQGYCLLTRKGRVIFYGKGQEAQPDLVMKYLQRVLCNVTMALLAACAVASFLCSSRKEVAAKYWLLFTVGLGTVLLLVATYTYAQRPRRDCGADYRQYFSVENLTNGTYARSDTRRRLHRCCSRNRTGHLRLCFGQKFPEPETLDEGLPAGVPSGGVTVSRGLPPALAAERSQAHKDRMEQEASKHHVGPMCHSVVSILALIGLIYDLVEFGRQSGFDSDVCIKKASGCHWRTDNPIWLGKQKHIEGAFPPTLTSKGRHCDEQQNFCNYYYQPEEHCLPLEQLGEEQLVKLPCHEIQRLADLVRPEHGRRGRHIYVTKKPRKFETLPTAMNSGDRQNVTIDSGMRLLAVGGLTTEWTAALIKQHSVKFKVIDQRCKDEHHVAMEFYFKREPDHAPLFEEDCQELQEACSARVFGPKTNGFWPPLNWFDPRKEHSLCWYRPVTRRIKIWHELESGGRDVPGLTCNSTPIESHTFASGRNGSLAKCKSKCEERKDCRYIFFSFPTANKEKICKLYSDCPRDEHPRVEQPLAEAFEAVKCGIPCSNSNVTNCDAMYQPFQSNRNVTMSVTACRHACMQASNDVVSCNAFAYYFDGPKNSTVCVIYGPRSLKPAFMTALSPSYPPGTVGPAGVTEGCFIRSFAAPPNRELAGIPGTLLEYTDKMGCSGCLTHSATKFLFNPSNFASVMQSVLNIAGFVLMFRVVQHSVQLGRVMFSGKPVVQMTIVEDVANKESFAARERGYATFLSRCFEVAAANSGFRPRPAPDVWQEDASLRHQVEDAEIVPVSRKSFDRWELSDALRTRCFVDKELLGLATNETVRAAWSDSKWLGFASPVFYSLAWLGMNVSFAVMAKVHGVLGVKAQFVVFLDVLLIGWAYYYMELRQELQRLVVVTSGGRLLQMSRRPPRDFLLWWRDGASVRLDSFNLGTVSMAQMDMPLVPLVGDRMRAGLRKPWRRGRVTAQCQKGLLCVRRDNGDILTVFKGLEELADAEKTEGLGTVGAGGGELGGLCPARDLFRGEERHVWERKLEAYGFFGDPFNYASLLTITDTRVLVTRVRTPKDLTLRALCLGPLSCGRRCWALQEHMGTSPFLTVSAVWRHGLESYATMRTRAAPFWPGFLAPVNSLSVAFLGSFMHSYPAGLYVTKRPYGIPSLVLVQEDVALESKDGVLRISHSTQPGAPRGHVVVHAKGREGRRLDPEDPRWAAKGGALVEKWTQLTLEAADPEWKGSADEPWLWQMRGVLDQFLGHSIAPAETWDDLGDGEDSLQPPPTRCSRMLAWVFGGDMLGHPARIDDEEDDSGEETDYEKPLV